MTLQAIAQKIFTFSALTTLVSLGWSNATSGAIAQVNNADHACYLYGSDGQHYDLSALCGAASLEASTPKNGASTETATESDTEAESGSAEVMPAQTAPTRTIAEPPRTVSEPLSTTGSRLPRIENTMSLPAVPKPAGS